MKRVEDSLLEGHSAQGCGSHRALRAAAGSLSQTAPCYWACYGFHFVFKQLSVSVFLSGVTSYCPQHSSSGFCFNSLWGKEALGPSMDSHM